MNSRQTSENRQSNKSAYLVAGLMSGLVDTFFHPFDTAAKILQNNDGIPRTYAEKYRVLYPNVTSSLWKGYRIALLHKLTHRSLMFGSTPHLESAINQVVGDKINQPAKQFLVGSSMGLVSLGLLPLDRAKVLIQLGSTKSVLEIMYEERLKMLNGASITLARDTLNLSILFGVSALVKSVVFNQNNQQTTPQQNFTASFIASMVAVVGTNSLDCAKTRIQNAQKQLPIRDAFYALAKEGPMFLFKGVTPRLLQYVPRLTIGKTIVDTMPPIISDWMNRGKTSPGSL